MNAPSEAIDAVVLPNALLKISLDRNLKNLEKFLRPSNLRENNFTSFSFLSFSLVYAYMSFSLPDLQKMESLRLMLIVKAQILLPPLRLSVCLRNLYHAFSTI